MPEALEIQLKLLSEAERYERFMQIYEAKDSTSKDLLQGILLGEDAVLKNLFLQYLAEIPEREAIQWILLVLADTNEIVRRTAQRAFERNQYFKKAQWLRNLITHPHPNASVYAIRFLAKRKDFAIVPALLRALPGQNPIVSLEIIKALSYLPETRSIAPLLACLKSQEEEIRLEALKTLGELVYQIRGIPAETFIPFIHDPQSKIRRIALSALQAFPSPKIAKIFSEKAFKDPLFSNRECAIQALASFPQESLVAPLVFLMLKESHSSLRLTIEVTLRRFPLPILKAGLLPLLDHPLLNVRECSAVLLSEMAMDDPTVQERLLRLWRNTKTDGERLALIDILGQFDYWQAVPLIFNAIRQSPALAYAGINLLSRFWTADTNREVLKLLKDPNFATLLKQSLLNVLNKRGPAFEIREELLEWIDDAVLDVNTNIRYLVLRLLGWYPLEQLLGPILKLLAAEKDPEVQGMAHQILLKALCRNPLPLVNAIRGIEKKELLIPHLLNVLKKGGWSPVYAGIVLENLIAEPLSVLATWLYDFFLIALQFYEKGALSFEKLWSLLPNVKIKEEFLRMLAHFLKTFSRLLPRIPVTFLYSMVQDMGKDFQIFFYQILCCNKQTEGIPFMMERILKEPDRIQREEAMFFVRELIWVGS